MQDFHSKGSQKRKKSIVAKICKFKVGRKAKMVENSVCNSYWFQLDSLQQLNKNDNFFERRNKFRFFCEGASLFHWPATRGKQLFFWLDYLWIICKK